MLERRPAHLRRRKTHVAEINIVKPRAAQVDVLEIRFRQVQVVESGRGDVFVVKVEWFRHVSIVIDGGLFDLRSPPTDKLLWRCPPPFPILFMLLTSTPTPSF